VEKNIYVIGAIYLLIAVIFLISIVVYEAIITHNFSLLAFIPFIILMWILDAEFLAIHKKYNG
jgi:hypothetical protein